MHSWILQTTYPIITRKNTSCIWKLIGQKKQQPQILLFFNTSAQDEVGVTSIVYRLDGSFSFKTDSRGNMFLVLYRTQ